MDSDSPYNFLPWLPHWNVLSSFLFENGSTKRGIGMLYGGRWRFSTHIDYHIFRKAATPHLFIGINYWLASSQLDLGDSFGVFI